MANDLFIMFSKFAGAYSVSRADSYRFMIYFAVTCMQVLGFPLHLLKVLGSDKSFLLFVTAFHLALVLLCFVLFIKRKISLVSTFNVYAVVSQLVHTIKVIYLTTVQPENCIHFILLNEFLSFIVIFVLVMSYIRYTPVLLTLVSTATACYPVLMLGDRVYFQFMVLFLFLGIFSCLLGEALYRKIKSVEDENKSYNDRENTVLRAFGISMKEFTAYIKLSTEQHKDEESVKELFKALGRNRAHNIADAVKMWNYINAVRTEKVKTAFPMLSQSELEVASLILQGKSLREICDITKKTENNVGTVRIHIRKKLGLQPDDNLNDFLVRSVRGL